MPISLTSLLEVKEQWDNIGPSLKDSYFAAILQREDSEIKFVELVKRERIVNYLEEIKCRLDRRLNYADLLILINYKRKWEGRIGRQN